MKTALNFIIFILLTAAGFSQNIWINDPQTWRGGQGTIEKTSITYEPGGLFTKVDWEITFSARGLDEFTETDTVEVVYNFSLPAGAIVTDSGL